MSTPLRAPVPRLATGVMGIEIAGAHGAAVWVSSAGLRVNDYQKIFDADHNVGPFRRES